MDNCIICKIINGDIPGDIVYEDNDVIAFKDINPVTPIHILIAPKKHIESVEALNENNIQILSSIFSAVKIISKKYDLSDKGYRIINNCGEDGGQTIKHMHFHFLGGRKLSEKLL